MKRTLLFLASAFISFHGIAQVTLTQAQTPPVNSMIIYHDANVPSPPFNYATSGTGNVWDFSTITPVPGQDDTLHIYAPSAVPLAATFPSATHCTQEGGDISVLEINASGVHGLGIISDPFGPMIALPLNPPVNVMPFPFTYPASMSNSTGIEIFATGAQVGQPAVDSVHAKSTLSRSASVIAEGSMILPSATYPALLQREINNQVDSIWVKGALTGNVWVLSGTPTVTIDSAFYWYSDQSIEHYAHALYDDTGLHDVHFFKDIVTGIKSSISYPSLQLFPVPAKDFVQISGLPAGSFVRYRVLSAQGELVLEAKGNFHRIPINGLASGVYFIELINESQTMQSLRFIKE